MLPTAMPPSADARAYGPPTWEDGQGAEIGMGATIGALAVFSAQAAVMEPLGRAFGVDMSMVPGAHRRWANAQSAGKVKWYHRAATFGPFPDPMPMGGMDIMDRFTAGTGPMFQRESMIGGWVSGKYPGLANAGDSVNRWFLHGMDRRYDRWKAKGLDARQIHGDILDAIDSSFEGRSRGIGGWLDRRQHLRSIIDGSSEAGPRTRPFASGGVMAKSGRYSKSAVRAVAKLQNSGMLMGAIGRGVAIVGLGAAVNSALQGAGRIYGTAYDRGLESVSKSKSSALDATRNPMSETLRMRALQDAAMRFGSMKAAIGNEAMAFHRY